MATTLVVKVIKRVQRIINDKTGIIWPESELLEDFNDAVKDIVLHRPDASTVNKVFDCTTSSSKQLLPSDALRLVEVIRNIGGNVITNIDRSTLNATRPDWHQSTPTIAIEHYVYDERDPKTFYLYPRPANNGEDAHQIEIVYSTCPADIEIDETSIKDGSSAITIPIDDTYSNAIIDFMLARAYSKDLGSAANANRSARHYQLYGNALGVKLQSDAMMMKEGG
tara:strand:+ start:1869 stop:2540 length:672 start_codon:yes stop_codon:yes gene_type:complete